MKILSIFTLSKEEKEKKAAERAARTLQRGQGALIDKLEAEKDKLEETMHKLLNLKVGDVDANWNQKFQDAKVALTLKSKEIEIANETTEEYFTEESK